MEEYLNKEEAKYQFEKDMERWRECAEDDAKEGMMEFGDMPIVFEDFAKDFMAESLSQEYIIQAQHKSCNSSDYKGDEYFALLEKKHEEYGGEKCEVVTHIIKEDTGSLTVGE